MRDLGESIARRLGALALFVFCVTGVLLADRVATAQSHGAQSHGSGWGFSGGPSGPYVLAHYDETRGKLVTLVRQGALGTLGRVGRPTMDADNRSIVATYASRFVSGLARFGPGGGTTILPTGGPFNGITDFDLDGNGDYFGITGTSIAPAALLGISRYGQVRRILGSTVLTSPLALERDIDTGDLIIFDYPSPSMTRLLRYDPRNAVVSTMTTTRFITEMAIEPATGDVFFCDPAQGLMRWNTVTGVSTIAGPYPYHTTSALAADRGSAARPRFIGALDKALPYAPRALLFEIDVASRTVTTLLTTPGVDQLSGIFPLQGRNVATLLRTRKRWEVNLSFPSEPSRAYACAITLSGTRPGFSLGRRLIMFNPDAVTATSAAGRLAPIFTGAAGRLDATGSATAWLDASSLPDLSGLRVHVIALILDPAAPFGVSTIADPALVIL